jgi:hypothetical protein
MQKMGKIKGTVQSMGESNTSFLGVGRHRVQTEIHLYPQAQHPGLFAVLVASAGLCVSEHNLLNFCNLLTITLLSGPAASWLVAGWAAITSRYSRQVRVRVGGGGGSFQHSTHRGRLVRF